MPHFVAANVTAMLSTQPVTSQTGVSEGKLNVSEIDVRGWVYIITTKSMPGLLKVGFTLKDPDLRAQELGRTGLPHPYVVEFEVLVAHPKAIEQKVHATLKNVREGKEWFRCSIEHAVSKIREAVGSNAILERIRGSLKAEATPIADPQPRELEQSKGSEPVGHKEIRRTATYAGPCGHCGSRFTVTLTRYDSGARCPICLRMNDASEFVRQEFII